MIFQWPIFGGLDAAIEWMAGRAILPMLIATGALVIICVLLTVVLAAIGYATTATITATAAIALSAGLWVALRCVYRPA